MKIPRGDQFGYQVAKPATGGGRVAADIPAGAFETGAGAGLQQLGAEGVKIAAEDLRQQRLEAERAAREAQAQQKRDEDQARRNIAAAAFARYQVDAEAAQSELSTELAEGRLKREDLPKAWQARVAKLRETHISTLDTQSKAELENNLILVDGRADQRLNGAIREHAKQQRADGYQQTREALQRLAVTDRASAIKQMEALARDEGAALFGAERAGKDLQAFREQVTFTDLDRRVSAAQNSRKTLEALGAQLAAPEYADLAPERRNFIESKIQRNLQNLDHRAEVAERRRLTALDQQQKRLSWYVENGRDIPQAEFDAFVKASRGTPFQGVADMIVGEQKAVSEFLRLPPDQMVAKVKELEKSYGPTPSREQLMHLDKVKRFADRSIKLLNEAPLEYAVARDGAKVEPLDMANPASWTGNLANRTAVLTEQSRRTGAAPKGLFPQEVQALSSYLRDAPVKEKSQILASLRKGFGDDRVYRATMQQLSPDDPVLAVAGVAAGRGLESPNAKAVSDLILRGQMVLRPNKKEDGSPGKAGLLPMPKDDVLLREFESYARDAFAGHEQARSAALQTARAIYAAKAADEGDFTGNLDSSRWRTAVELATGGIEKHNGRRIVLPWGMPLSDFKDGVRARVSRFEGRLAEGRTTAELAGLPLENAGDGKYVFRAGDGIVYGKDGKPVVLDFNEPTPFVPSGAKSSNWGVDVKMVPPSEATRKYQGQP